MKVDLMIIGAMKCGTTTLADLLKAHPGVSFCREKEPEFFSKHADWRKGLDAYHALFEQREGALYAEASTGFTFYPLLNHAIWEDLYQYNPGLKFIYLVRDPIDRIVSHYMHIFERGYMHHTLEEALRMVPILFNNTRYHTQVLPFIERFGRERVLLLDFADLVSARPQVLERVAHFAGIDPAAFPSDPGIHSNPSVGGRKRHHLHDAPPAWIPSHRSMSRRLRDGVRRFLVPKADRGFDRRPELSDDWKQAVMRLLELEVIALERLMNKDLSSWFVHAGLPRPEMRTTRGR